MTTLKSSCDSLMELFYRSAEENGPKITDYDLGMIRGLSYSQITDHLANDTLYRIADKYGFTPYISDGICR